MTGLSSRISFRQGDLFEALEAGELFDAILSNPPYIPTGEIPGLAPEVLRDPLQSLDGGMDGLDLIRRLVENAAHHLKKGGFLLFEIGLDQSTPVQNLLKAAGYHEIVFMEDLQKIPRVARARRP